MKISVNVVLVTPETIRIIYPSKEPVFNGKRSLAQHATSRWYGKLAHDLNNQTYLSDLIEKHNNEFFSSSCSTSDTSRKIQAVNESLELSEFFIGGQILIPFCSWILSNKIYLHDKEMPLDYLGDYLLSDIRKQINTLDFKQYVNNNILLSVDII